MAISDNDYKLLWGRAAGHCSSPTCRTDLTVLIHGSRSYTVGEMAHIIAKQPSGPRGVEDGGPDSYENLILLCPTCHRKIDKAPETQYPINLLHAWKTEHEAAIQQAGQQQVFKSAHTLKRSITLLLIENRALWESLGPQSPSAQSDPGSNLHHVWELRKLDKIVPNNRAIINSIEANLSLLDANELSAFAAFKVHAGAFEASQYRRIDSYPCFPERFGQLFTI